MVWRERFIWFVPHEGRAIVGPIDCQKLAIEFGSVHPEPTKEEWSGYPQSELRVHHSFMDGQVGKKSVIDWGIAISI